MAHSGARPAERPLPARAAQLFMSLAVRGYRMLISPAIGPRCRHLPTCSEYALEALEVHGPARGAWLTLRRVSRCHPWGTSGYDPVPEAEDGAASVR